MSGGVRHLARRFLTSLSRAEPSAADTAWACAQLLPAEAALWQRLSVQDRRHSLLVARRFVALAGEPGREEVAAALLHDIGKLDCGLGTIGRVVATIVGPRGRRFRHYHDHERIGAELLRAAGSSPVTVELVQGRGPAAATLGAADDV
jgi:putative nucleotidyltransferase with HDIG domain